MDKDKAVDFLMVRITEIVAENQEKDVEILGLTEELFATHAALTEYRNDVIDLKAEREITEENNKTVAYWQGRFDSQVKLTLDYKKLVDDWGMLNQKYRRCNTRIRVLLDELEQGKHKAQTGYE